MLLTVGGENRKKPTRAPGEHANSTQRDPGDPTLDLLAENFKILKILKKIKILKV